jgi:hypothetical protein
VKRFLALIVLAACSGASPTIGGNETQPQTSTIDRTDVERDLTLELTRKTNEGYDDERDPRFEVWLVNRSRTVTYPIVLSNDGSESGWREPTVGFTAEKKTAAGAWEAIPKQHAARCGLYAQDWTQDVKTLAPGARVKLEWFKPWPLEEVGDATRVRFVAHYSYGDHARDKSKVPPILHAMPEYAIASAPFEIPVARPFRLDLTVKGALPTAVDIAMVNQSGTAQSFDAFEQGQLELELETVLADGSKNTQDVRIENGDNPKAIAPGARHTLVGGRASLSYPPSFETGERPVRVRAVWRAWEHDGGDTLMRVVVSPWIPVK